ncbi:hypothetical protein HPB48_022027 [Haemaphysalis longicornis]|uniref:Uncharacterized protein n=1 Tax=Haemaphysalis longicornis TaxID=44386 RepID=A0A9J6H653_HAELO|nr:hypothetical protein HPB48_022027 [Haemaphysalis longicornis]
MSPVDVSSHGSGGNGTEEQSIERELKTKTCSEEGRDDAQTVEPALHKQEEAPPAWLSNFVQAPVPHCAARDANAHAPPTSPIKINDIKEDDQYYIDSCQDPDFEENDFFHPAGVCPNGQHVKNGTVDAAARNSPTGAEGDRPAASTSPSAIHGDVHLQWNHAKLGKPPAEALDRSAGGKKHRLYTLGRRSWSMVEQEGTTEARR